MHPQPGHQQAPGGASALRAWHRHTLCHTELPYETRLDARAARQHLNTDSIEAATQGGVVPSDGGRADKKRRKQGQVPPATAKARGGSLANHMQQRQRDRWDKLENGLFLLPIFNPDNIYFITQWNFYIYRMYNKISSIKLILITTLVFKILSFYCEIHHLKDLLGYFSFSYNCLETSRYSK